MHSRFEKLTGMRLFTGIFNWFRNEANARATTTLVTVASLVGGILYFAQDRLVDDGAKIFSNASFADGYNSGKRETELELDNLQLRSKVEIERTLSAIQDQAGSMSDEERKKILLQDL
jgi:hypothetical protein